MKMTNNNEKRVRFITCEVILDEVKGRIPQDWEVASIEKRLHERSDELREKLQAEIDTSRGFDIIFLGFGLCGKSVEGLVSRNATLVIPKCDDCIAMLLGSVEAYKEQSKKEPGIYYLTRGYIGEADGDIIGGDFSQVREKYDDETWKWLIKEMLKNYRRLVFINTGNYDPGEWRQKALEEAEKLDLRFEEIESTGHFLDKIAKGDWDRDFIIIEPGQKVTTDMFINK